MRKTLTVTLVVIGGIVLIGLIFSAGIIVAKANGGISGLNPFTMMSSNTGNRNSGYSIIGNGNGMMGGARTGITGNVKPLTVDQARQAVEGYLRNLNNPDLELKEIMIFDNNAYARITEKSTGIGAMELLVDPTSLSVFPEYGPNMMWNLKYGQGNVSGGIMGRNTMMSGSSIRGGYTGSSGSVPATMTVTSDQAVNIAQQYLDQQFPGYTADTNPDPFYGYYTIDIFKDGKPTGMLSVNGYSGQVFLHTWHGTFIEGSE